MVAWVKSVNKAYQVYLVNMIGFRVLVVDWCILGSTERAGQSSLSKIIYMHEVASILMDWVLERGETLSTSCRLSIHDVLV